MRRVYSDDYVAEALAVVEACGGNIQRASQTTGVPRKTLEGWATGRVQRVSSPEVVDGMSELRNEKDIAWQLAEAIPDKIKNAPLNQIFIQSARSPTMSPQGSAAVGHARDSVVLKHG